MTRQKLAQKRNYFKFVLSGMYKPIDMNALTQEEQEKWLTILHLRKDLIRTFDSNSIEMGLNVPMFRVPYIKNNKPKI